METGPKASDFQLSGKLRNNSLSRVLLQPTGNISYKGLGNAVAAQPRSRSSRTSANPCPTLPYSYKAQIPALDPEWETGTKASDFQLSGKLRNNSLSRVLLQPTGNISYKGLGNAVAAQPRSRSSRTSANPCPTLPYSYKAQIPALDPEWETGTKAS